MKLTMPMSIFAANSNERTITGRIVAFEEPANASTGKVVFAKGSIEPAPVLLNLEHDRTRRIGKTLAMNLTPDEMAINASFKIAATTAGNDSLVEASEGLKDGFSVEVEVSEYEIDKKSGVMRVIAGELTGVALVSEPAVRSARVSDVAATEGEEKDSVPTEETENTENEETVSESTDSVSTEVSVEAAQAVTAAASTGVGYTKPRLDTRPETYLFHQINASLRTDDSDESRQYIRAAADTTDNAGLIKTPQLQKVINGLSSFVRPTIEAISSETMPTDGMTFEIPKITQAPLAGIVAENGAFTEQDQNSAFISVSKQKFTAQQKFSVELFTLSNPSYYTNVIRNMNAAMATKQDAYANSVLVTNATADGTTVVTYPTATELLGFVARGASSVYENCIGLPNPFAVNMIGNTKQWANIISLNDNGRPIYAASNPMNAGGQVTTRARRGMVVDMDFFVTANTAATTDTDGSLLIVNPDAYTWYEDPSMYQLRAESTADGSITLGLYSFGAVAVNIAAGAFKINKA